ncbi:MAG: sigma 54-interacting transcriptional regulator, partial [Eubacteriales bacterium]|nr:sigma 54-interacting transcriptional regulator [Eubacteriales bacterium]
MSEIELMQYKLFYDQIYKKVMDYREEIQKIGFASPEAQILSCDLNDIKSLAQCVGFIIASNIDLNKIFEVCPDSVYVVDKVGNTLRANKAFEHTTGVSRINVFRENVYFLEKKGCFMPSVNGIALREKRAVSIIQMGMNGKETIVTGVPIFDHDGEIYGSVSNAKLLNEINSIIEYVGESQKKFEKIQYGNTSKMICESEAMREIIKMVDHIIDTDSSILITGETGVGKGLLTRYIHDHSKRKEHRLVEINCGAIPETLLESELFGYESGAFTGADKRGKPGLIELADGGTILFDEVNELPLMLQVKLLHFLQNKKITRVGGTNEILVDTRIIAASNKKLEKLVLEEKFRADLYYRLNVIPIEIPPLRDRPEDLIAATEY